MFKRNLLLFISFSALIFSIMSCSGGGDGESSGGSSNEENVELTSGRILGRVRNADTSEFISGAVISAGGVSDTTGVVGSYWLDDVSEGYQTLTATAAGYADYLHSITVEGGVANSHDIEMKPFYTISVPVTKDTYINKNFPYSIHGDSVLIQTTYAENVRKDALLYAPISDYIPLGAEIKKVVFVGYSSDVVWDFLVAPIESSWDEYNVTWYTRPSQGWGISEYDTSKNGSEYRIDVSWPFTSSTYASSAIEYGICIMSFENKDSSDWNGIWFYSREHSTLSYHPWFEVTYIK